MLCHDTIGVTYTQRDRETDNQTDTQTDTQTDRQKHKHTDIHTNRQRDRQTHTHNIHTQRQIYIDEYGIHTDFTCAQKAQWALRHPNTNTKAADLYTTRMCCDATISR